MSKSTEMIRIEVLSPHGINECKLDDRTFVNLLHNMRQLIASLKTQQTVKPESERLAENLRALYKLGKNEQARGRY